MGDAIGRSKTENFVYLSAANVLEAPSFLSSSVES